MSRTSNRRIMAEEVPKLNVPWTHNRASAGHSYRQDNFHRTIPNPGSLPLDLAPRTLVTPGPHFSNAPKVTMADKYAEAYLRKKDEKMRIDAYQESLKNQVVNNEGIRPFGELPQSVAQVNLSRHTKPEPLSMNFKPLSPRPPTAGSGSNHFRSPSFHNVVEGPTAFQPVKQIRDEDIPTVTGIRKVLPQMTNAQIGDEPMSDRGKLNVPYQVLDPMLTIKQVSSEAMRVNGPEVKVALRWPGGGNRALHNSVRDITDAFRNNMPHRRPSAPPPLYPYGQGHIPQALDPQAPSAPPAGNVYRRRPVHTVIRRPPPVQQSALDYTSPTGHLPGGARISRPPSPDLNLDLPTVPGRYEDPGWFMQGIDDGPSRPTKRNKQPEDKSVKKAKGKKKE